MEITTTVAPEIEPITTDQARDQVRQDLTDEDELLDVYVVAARVYAENHLHRRLITQTVKIITTGFHGPALALPILPIQSVDLVQYKQTTDGALTTLAASDYQLVRTIEPAHLAPAWGLTWPTVRNDFDSVEITMTVGYGDAPEDVPEDIRQAIRLLMAHFYENRANEMTGTTKPTKYSIGAERLLAPHVLAI